MNITYSNIFSGIYPTTNTPITATTNETGKIRFI